MGVFEAVRQVEKDEDGVTRYKWVSLRKKRGFKFFDAFSESVKNFKEDFFYVVPVNDAVMAEVVTYGAAGEIEATQFHFDWSYDHFLVKINTYSRKETQLGQVDKRTLGAEIYFWEGGDRHQRVGPG